MSKEAVLMTPGYYTQRFDTWSDFDQDGCSISLDLDIEELINGDFDDHTTVLTSDATWAAVTGTGIAPRPPAPQIRTPKERPYA